MMGDMVADMVEPVYCRGGAGVLGTPAPPGLAATRRLALARTTGPMRVEPPLGGSLRGALVYRYPQLLRLHMEVAARSADSTGAPAGSADSAGAPARSAGALGDGAWPRPSTLAPPPVQSDCLVRKQFPKRPLQRSAADV